MTIPLYDTYWKEGYDLAIQNSKSLFKISENAALGNEFGIACSLNILSAEEALKASFLIIKHYNPKGQINEFDKIFKDHKIKHEQLKQFVEFQDKMQIQLKAQIAILEPLINLARQMSKETQEKNKTDLFSLEETLTWLKQRSKTKLNFGEILNWLKNANNIKNRGFYLDRQNDKWLAPQNITIEKYDMEKLYTKAIIEYAISIEELFVRLNTEKNSRERNRNQ